MNVRELVNDARATAKQITDALRKHEADHNRNALRELSEAGDK